MGLFVLLAFAVKVTSRNTLLSTAAPLICDLVLMNKLIQYSLDVHCLPQLV
jgi:hypothetical protein